MSDAATAWRLRVLPPRVPADLLVRARLRSTEPAFRDAPVVVVRAPVGFGKTALLAQWRNEHLARGYQVSWLTASEDDEPGGLVHALTHAVRAGTGRDSFGGALLHDASASALELATGWLAEIATVHAPQLLIVDRAERLAPPALAVLGYLLNNMPVDLRAVLGWSSGGDATLPSIVEAGTTVQVDRAMLAFRLEETIALVRQRLGDALDLDSAAALHGITDGWPLGVQLVLADVGRRDDPRSIVRSIAAHVGEPYEQLVDLLLARLPAPDLDFLVRIAEPEVVHPALCERLLEQPDARERLARLARDTPSFTSGLGGEWLRMQALVRERLRLRFQRLPEEERRALHRRASRWFAEQEGLLAAAAHHALAAGDRADAWDLAERSLYEEIVGRGGQATVLRWLDAIPEQELHARPRLMLAAAWALAVSERHAEAGRLVESLLAREDIDDAMHCECALVLAGAAVYADEPDRFAALHDPWAEHPPLRDPLLQHVHANRRAFRAMLDGDPALARRRQQQAPTLIDSRDRYIVRWGHYITALSYLWEGQVMLVETLLRPQLASAEGELGRRHPFVCMLASVLASAVWERGQPEEASSLLAHRLDVLERGGLPETVMLAYRTAARVAAAQGEEHRALDLLEALNAVGVERSLPRMCIASLADQVRFHASRERPQICAALCARLEKIVEGGAHGPLWQRIVAPMRATARAQAAIAALDWPAALALLDEALSVAESASLGRLRIELMVTRALVLQQLGRDGRTAWVEAIGLANTYGLVRVLAGLHPVLAEHARALGGGARLGLQAGGDAASASEATVGRERVFGPAAARSGARDEAPGIGASRARPSIQAQPEPVPEGNALTPREREILGWLAHGLSNKEIARAMQVGEQTVKWHMKNLLAKLSAGSRKHAVHRARLLGLLAPA